MSTRWGAIRDNLVAAIKALPGINGTPVVKLGVPEDVWPLGMRDVIGVCLTEDDWLDIDEGISDYRDRPALITIPVVVKTTSEWPPESALNDGGKIEELCQAILGSNIGTAGAGVRGVDIGLPGVTGGVYVRAVSSQIVAGQDRTPGSGGSICKVLTMKSTVLPL